jgi:6,7-dimethyl-8-ribityllumazine synthase
MAGKGASSGVPDRIKAHLLVIEARYYERICDELLAGVKAACEAAGATYEVVSVPGALEIPQVLARAADAGLIGADAEFGDLYDPNSDGPKYDGAIALGCVIRGETSHYDIVCEQSNYWLMETAIGMGVSVGNAILTVENEAQAMARAEGGINSKGAEAVRACLALIKHARAFDSEAAS